jgi:hypothetical protein
MNRRKEKIYKKGEGKGHEEEKRIIEAGKNGMCKKGERKGNEGGKRRQGWKEVGKRYIRKWKGKN